MGSMSFSEVGKGSQVIGGGLAIEEDLARGIAANVAATGLMMPIRTRVSESIAGRANSGRSGY